MGIRYYKPTTPGRRGASVSDFAEITDRKKKPEKSLVTPFKKKGGRNFQGVICSRFRGGGHKRMYRIIDFKRDKLNVWASVESIEYDPNRSCRIALLKYEDGVKSYILAPEGLKAGDRVMSGEEVEPRVGNALPLRKIPLGMAVHNLEMQPGRGGQLCRSAGASATLTAREGPWAQITLPSGEVRRIPSDCRATIGALGNADHMNISLGKAGRKRWKGRKPHNRGTSMNPVSHPMGGGEGRTAGGRHPCGPTGVLSKGGKTRKKRKPSNKAIIRRRRPGPHYAQS
ncbi:MAG: 50S ribosomal protein L2 [Gemmataceae bacterium]|nr:50S ribosomal protein L2 [Gemmataceae bacterium]MCI0739616.1 50S ribosomal protein L2 [Gemmataceae bacterium]